jgi:hypothetical protein
MDFLSEVEGLRGEQLATATLRWLLVRSQEFRENLIALISKASRLGPVHAAEQFAAFLEYPTSSGEGSPGRVDLVIEIDQWVLGVESKFFAVFQEGQPSKYLESLQRRAAQLAQVRGFPYGHAVVILAPRARMAEVAAHCGDDSQCMLLTWEDVLAVAQEPKLDVDGAARAVLGFLSRFVDNRIAFLPSFRQWVPHLRNRWESSGSALQRDVVAALWEFLPEGGKRLSAGATWCGYYFCNSSPKLRGWYGFVDGNIIGAPSHQAEFIIATNFDLVDPPVALRRIETFNQNFLGGYRPVTAWVIDFDEKWADPQRWTEALACIGATVSKLEAAG